MKKSIICLIAIIVILTISKTECYATPNCSISTPVCFNVNFKATVKTIKSKKSKIHIKFDDKKASYIIQISKSKDFKKAKTYVEHSNKFTSPKLKKGQTYYVRSYMIKKVKDVITSGNWNKPQKIKIK